MADERFGVFGEGSEQADEISDLVPVEPVPPWPWLIVGAEHRHTTTAQECGCAPGPGRDLGVCEDPED